MSTDSNPNVEDAARAVTKERAREIAQRLVFAGVNEDAQMGDVLLIMSALVYTPGLVDRELLLYEVRRVFVSFSDRASTTLDALICERLNVGEGRGQS